jgi:hypothetical protein
VVEAATVAAAGGVGRGGGGGVGGAGLVAQAKERLGHKLPVDLIGTSLAKHIIHHHIRALIGVLHFVGCGGGGTKAKQEEIAFQRFCKEKQEQIYPILSTSRKKLDYNLYQ